MQNAFSRLWMKQVVNLSIFFMSVSSELQSSVSCLLFLEKYLQISVEKSMYFQSNFLLLSKTRKYDFLPNFDLILW